MNSKAGNQIKHSLWLTTPNQTLIEIALDHGFTDFVLDIEHGLFDLAETDRLVSFCLRSGASTFAKVRGGGVDAVQQMLDRGCNGVIIPHIENVEHARLMSAAVKYPPLGIRSFDGGRTVGFGAAPKDYFEICNHTIQAIPMIETASSLAVVDEIALLPTVDALFVGPYDLSLSAGRGRYLQTAEDDAALHAISAAARAAGKSWWMPAWTEQERTSAKALGASHLVVAEELGMFHQSLSELAKALAPASE